MLNIWKFAERSCLGMPLNGKYFSPNVFESASQVAYTKSKYFYAFFNFLIFFLDFICFIRKPKVFLWNPVVRFIFVTLNVSKNLKKYFSRVKILISYREVVPGTILIQKESGSKNSPKSFYQNLIITPPPERKFSGIFFKPNCF